MPGSIETDTANVDELNRDISEEKKTSISDGQAPLSEDGQTIYKTSPSLLNCASCGGLGTALKGPGAEVRARDRGVTQR